MDNISSQTTLHTTSLDYVCIFTGGSIRGGAYVGALKAIEQLNANIKCFTGSSVGSVIAVFYALGYSTQELEEIVNNFNFALFKDINISFNKDFSISKGEHFLEWLREIIEKKYYKDKYEKGKNPPVTFEMVERDLIIITTDLYTTKAKTFSKKETPDFEIAQAVRISSSMPGLLKPILYNGHLLVDGDLSRSWPIWKLLPELLDYDARILEFRLEGGKERYKLENPADFFNSVYTTFSNFAADYIINTYKNKDKFDYIRLDAGEINVTDFNIPLEKKQALYALGYRTTMDFFKYELPAKRAAILPYYKKFFDELKQIKALIESSKYIIAKNRLAELFVDISKARKVIDMYFYDKILEFYELFMKNLFLAMGMFSLVKQKKEIICTIEQIITELDAKIAEIETFINDVELIH